MVRSQTDLNSAILYITTTAAATTTTRSDQTAQTATERQHFDNPVNPDFGLRTPGSGG